MENSTDPRGVAVDDSTSTIYVADYGNSRVQVFNYRRKCSSPIFTDHIHKTRQTVWYSSTRELSFTLQCKAHKQYSISSAMKETPRLKKVGGVRVTIKRSFSQSPYQLG